MPDLADLLNTVGKSNEKITVKNETTKTETVDSENELRWWCPELYEESGGENDSVEKEHLEYKSDPEQNKQTKMTDEELIKFIAKGPPVFWYTEKKIHKMNYYDFILQETI